MKVNGQELSVLLERVTLPLDKKYLSQRTDSGKDYFPYDVYKERMDQVFGVHYYFSPVGSPQLIEISTNTSGVVKKSWVATVELNITNEDGVIIHKTIGVGSKDPILTTKSNNPVNTENDLLACFTVAQRNAIKDLMGPNGLATTYNGGFKRDSKNKTDTSQYDATIYTATIALKSKFRTTQKSYVASAVDTSTNKDIELVIWLSEEEKIGKKVVDNIVKKAVLDKPFTIQYKKGSFNNKIQYQLIGLVKEEKGVA